MNKKMLFKLMLMLVMSMLVLAGCGKQAKIDKADSERIAAIEEKIDVLFNKEKDDIVEGIEEKQFDEIDKLLEKEEGNEFSEENALRIGSIVLYLGQAKNMFDLQNKVASLVDKDGVVNEEMYEDIKEHIVDFKQYKTFHERQITVLDKVEKLYKEQLAQAEHNNKTEKALANLFTKEGKVNSDVTQKQYDEVAKLVNKVKNEEIKTTFEKDLKKVDDQIKAIAKAEKEEAERKAEEERQQQLAQQKEQGAKQQQSNSVQSSQSASNSNASNNQQSSKVNSSNNGSSNSSKGNSTTSNAKTNNKGNTNSSNNSNKGSSSNNSNNNGFMNGMTDKEINDYFNNSDCTHVESGYIDGENGNTYDKYQCK